jgi:cytoskeletal protein RodZ
MDSDPWYARIFILKARSKRTKKERKNKMNESQQQKQPEKESFVAFGFLLAVVGLGLLAGILKLVGLF